MKKMNIMITNTLIIFVLLFSGCAAKANFANTPVIESEFEKPMSILSEKYADIGKYDRFFAAPYQTANLEELEAKWGEGKEHKNWGNYFLGISLGAVLAAFVDPIFLVVYILNPLPKSDYSWEKGNYKINVKTRKDIFVGYDEKFFSWEWEEKEKHLASKLDK